jgi:phage terminase large subunit
MAADGGVVEIPYAPRKWARAMHESYKRWAVLVLHRRAGKTTSILNHHQRAALDDDWERKRLRFLLPDAPDSQIAALMKNRVYWHVMPTFKQAKMVSWDLLKRYADPIPGIKKNESELMIRYPNGSKLQLIGADNPDSLRGPGLSGLSCDEFSQHPPNVFGEVLSKALADHVGYAIFAGTIQGQDQLFKMHDVSKDDPAWFSVWQNVDVSLATESGPTITALRRAMEDDRALIAQGVMTQAEFDQEWFLSPEAAIKGAIYGKELSDARSAGRIATVPYDPALPVDTDWDLGVLDPTAIWFSQSTRGGEVRLIDYYEANGEGLPHFASVLRDKGYVYGDHWAPHDIQVRELSSGRSRKEAAAALGIHFKLGPQVSLEDGVHAARLMLPRCWFDSTKTRLGIEALTHYRRQYNTRLNEFTATPVHDLYSHGADAFRGLSVRHQVPREKKVRQEHAGRLVGQGWMG